MIKIMIADDQELIRESLKIVLSEKNNIKITHTVSNGFQVLQKIKLEEPDIILMDIRMPNMDGVECTKQVKEKYPQIKIIILTTFDDDEYVFNALRYGASGYMLKGDNIDKLYQAICTVYDGLAMMNSNITSKVVRLFSELAKKKYFIEVDSAKVKQLTSGEWKIIRAIEKGFTNKEIAETLFLSEGTIRNYLTIILDKLDLRDRTQLAIWAVQCTIKEDMV